MTIGTNIDVFEYNLFYYKSVRNNNLSAYYSDVSIYGVNDNNNHHKKIATFFKHSNLNFGIEQLLNNMCYLSKMKLKVFFTHSLMNESLNMRTYIYIEKQFFLSLYLHSNLPRFLFKIIMDTPENKYYIPYNEIQNSSYSSNFIELKKIYKRPLYPHQVNNVNRTEIFFIF